MAHLTDQTLESAADLVKVLSLVNSDKAQSAPPAAEVKLPKKVKEDFEFLMWRCQSHPKVADWISSTVDVFRGR